MDISFYLQKAREIINDPNPPANATLTFYSGGETVTFDSVGNPIVDDGEEINIECWLRQEKPPENEVQTGLNLDRVYFVGELVNPKSFSTPLRPNEEIRIVVNGRSGTFVELKLFDSPASVGWGIVDYHGQKIAGWVQFKEGD